MVPEACQAPVSTPKSDAAEVGVLTGVGAAPLAGTSHSPWVTPVTHQASTVCGSHQRTGVQDAPVPAPVTGRLRMTPPALPASCRRPLSLQITEVPSGELTAAQLSPHAPAVAP